MKDIDKFDENPQNPSPQREPPGVEKASFGELYLYLGKGMGVYFGVGVVSSVVSGAAGLSSVFIVRELFDELSGDMSRNETGDVLRKYALWFLVGASVQVISTFIFFWMFNIIGQTNAHNFKYKYLVSILKQDANWYDQINSQELAAKINADWTEIENASGKTIGVIISWVTGAIVAVGLTQFHGWLLGIISMFWFVIFVTFGLLQATAVEKGYAVSEASYVKSGAVCEEALTAIKIVKAFGQEQRELSKYQTHLNSSESSISKTIKIYSICQGFLEFSMYLCSSYIWLIGGIFVIEGVENSQYSRFYLSADVVGIYYSICKGGYILSCSSQNLKTVNRGRIAAKSALNIIQRTPEILLDEPEKQKVSKLNSDILFENVTFQYFGRKEYALNSFSVRIPQNKVTAFVGESGCGKSTIMKLLQRFYDPQEGRVVVNGQNLKEFNLRSVRRRIGYVGQEPTLFNDTVENNIRKASPGVTDDEIDQALKDANAYKFVQKLKNGKKTFVGTLGVKLSGGQKQRIAIARALVRKPDLLILDEATSALDQKNERSVQVAIDNIAKSLNITTIVIAHRFSTIKDADIIHVLRKGAIVESGTHSELINLKGRYENLYRYQNFADYVEKNNLSEENSSKFIEEISSDESDDLHEESGSTSSESKKKVLELENTDAEMEAMKIFRRLSPYTKPFALVVIATCLVLYIGSGKSLINMISAGIAVDLLKASDGSTSLSSGDLLFYCALIIILGLVAVLAESVCRWSLLTVSHNMVQNLRSTTYGSLLNKPIEFHERRSNSIGNIIGVLSSDVKSINGASIEMYIMIFRGLAGFFAGGIITAFYDWKISLFSIWMIPFNCTMNYLAFEGQFKPAERPKKVVDNERIAISDSILNYSLVSSLVYEEEFVEKCYIDIKKIVRSAALFGISTIAILGYMTPLYYIAADNIQNHDKDLRDQIIAIYVAIWSSLEIGMALQTAPNLGSGIASATKILGIIDSPEEGERESSIIDGEAEISPEEAQGDIEFKGVYFAYPNSRDTWVLKNFNLKIKGGQSVGIAGSSGCGKSTMIQLLYRFYDPQQGSICIGGKKIREYSIKSLRASFGIVQQEPLLFNRSILENVCYSKNHASVGEIKKTTNLANASEFIKEFGSSNDNREISMKEIERDDRYSQLDDGYRVVCGLKGNKLSGGQKQRIAIARALIHKPKVLMFDEATSALDEVSQSVVQSSLNKAIKHSTSLVIAHRLSTLKHWDKVILIAHGTVIREGSFHDFKHLEDYHK